MTGPALWRRLAASRSGVAATEFAIVLPFLLGVGLMGLEVANRAIVQMQVSQLAAHIADNASRIGDTSTLQDRRIYERDLNDLFYGADVQGSNRLDLFKNGRVIVSSLEEVWAFPDEAVIFVEIAYDYQSLVGKTFGFSDVVRATASFTVRDDRDLSQIYQREPDSPEPDANCAVYGSLADYAI